MWEQIAQNLWIQVERGAQSINLTSQLNNNSIPSFSYIFQLKSYQCLWYTMNMRIDRAKIVIASLALMKRAIRSKDCWSINRFSTSVLQFLDLFYMFLNSFQYFLLEVSTFSEHEECEGEMCKSDECKPLYSSFQPSFALVWDPMFLLIHH